MRKRWMLYVLFIACFAASLSSQEQKAPSFTREVRLLDLATLWQEVNYNFVHFDLRPDLDWQATFLEFIPKVLAAETPIEHIRVLQQFLASLGEGHTNVVPDKPLWKENAGMPPIELRMIEVLPVVTNTASELASVIPVGSVIQSVDGFPVDRYLAERVFPYISASTATNLRSKAIRGTGEPAIGLLVGKPGSEITITFEAPDGRIGTQRLERMAPDAAIEWIQTPQEKLPVLSLKWLEGNIAYFELNTFAKEEVVQQFEKHMEDLRRANGVILDVRNNGGGNSDYGWAIGSHFISQPVAASKSKFREHISVYKALGGMRDSPYRAYRELRAWKEGGVDFVKPSEPNFQIPVVVLIGFDTYSAAEDFAAFAVGAPGFTLIGEATAGSTGQPLVFRLPSRLGWAAVTAKRDELPDGTRFVGAGIQPDILIRTTLRDFRSGHDPVLDRAAQILKSAQ